MFFFIVLLVVYKQYYKGDYIFNETESMNALI